MKDTIGKVHGCVQNRGGVCRNIPEYGGVSRAGERALPGLGSRPRSQDQSQLRPSLGMEGVETSVVLLETRPVKYERNHRWSAKYGGNGTTVKPEVHGNLEPEGSDGQSGSLTPSMKDVFGKGYGHVRMR